MSQGRVVAFCSVVHLESKDIPIVVQDIELTSLSKELTDLFVATDLFTLVERRARTSLNGSRLRQGKDGHSQSFPYDCRRELQISS
jgi:hypothetical protein